MSIQVVRKNEETRSFELSIADLEDILSQKDFKDREIVVISIAGAFRKGKSFMLNFFLKYLNERVKNINLSVVSVNYCEFLLFQIFSIKEKPPESNGWMMETNV